MRIGIIGAGNMGDTLAAQLARLGHQVAIANYSRSQTLTAVTAQKGAVSVTLTDVNSKADVVIVDSKEKRVHKILAGLLSALLGDTVVIDKGNYVHTLRDGHIDNIDAGLQKANGSNHSRATGWSRRSTPSAVKTR